ncbi:dystrobrevin binding protein 1b isoform X2 [Betta splendens]|uniref:Dystrobrevin binding protein 1b isoform X2 n=1 Tax=Betta splendens TaxID=158456 RepID=A0A9W2Y3U4_BETSP|nr:dystrobrevin binding protein 1b isoform X2 [Betta splendens]
MIVGTDGASNTTSANPDSINRFSARTSQSCITPHDSGSTRRVVLHRREEDVSVVLLVKPHRSARLELVNASFCFSDDRLGPGEVELDAEHQQRVPGTEQGGVPTPQVKLKERQKFFEEAFQQDMEQYLSTGYLQIAERRGSMSSMEVNVDMLEQMDLMDMSDHEALDVFLHSGGEDNSAASPVAGPDVESFTTEISLQVPTQAELRHKLSSLSSTCTESASQDTEAGEEEEDEEEEEEAAAEQAGGGVGGSGGGRRKRPPVVVTQDEEEVHPDTALVERLDQEEQAHKDCEESRPKARRSASCGEGMQSAVQEPRVHLNRGSTGGEYLTKYE